MTGYGVAYKGSGIYVKYQAYMDCGVVYCGCNGIVFWSFKDPEGGRFFSGDDADKDSESFLNSLRGTK